MTASSSVASSPASTSSNPRSRGAVTTALIDELAKFIVSAPGAETTELCVPTDGSVLATLPVTTVDQVSETFETARQAQKAWAARSVSQRADILLAFHDIVLRDQKELMDIVQVESGKARVSAFEEILDVAMVSRHYARRASKYLGPSRNRGMIPVLTASTERLRPRGVVGIIAPWNYPLSMGITDALPALLAGNTVVTKPDSQTPLTLLWCARALREAGLPDGVLSVVYGSGRVVGTEVINNADYVQFTGSTATGRIVAKQAGERLIGCSLELGGKNAMYITDDINIDAAVECAVRSSYANAGQLCVSIERLVVHKDIADQFIAAFASAVKELKLGAGLDFSYDIGSLINKSQLTTVTEHVQDAVDKGATILAGGKPRPDIGPYYFEPTVLQGVTPEATCYDSETFGPLVSVYTVASDAEAIDFMNNTQYGLNAAVWTSDESRGQRIAEQVVAGTINVNEGYVAAWGSVASPMGGMKQSGIGRRHGREGIKKYCESQNISTQHLANYGLGMQLMHKAPGSVTARTMTGLMKAMKISRLS